MYKDMFIHLYICIYIYIYIYIYLHTYSVIVTTSLSMRERALCPPSCLVSTNTEEALIDICKEYGLNLTQERFLTVCGKCGGEIEACSHTDTRITSNKEVTMNIYKHIHKYVILFIYVSMNKCVNL
jgi:uncharacterized protein with PIN domain